MTFSRSAVYPLLLTATVIVVVTGNRCQLKPVKGPCRARIKMFYFNWNKWQCKEFIYGGCRGNGNRFETLEECELACDNYCNLPKETGPCRAAFRRWFYNKNTRSCERFIYGGCQGNRNNFLTLQECQAQCMLN